MARRSAFEADEDLLSESGQHARAAGGARMDGASVYVGGKPSPRVPYVARAAGWE
jgi:hypothetical protein